MAARAESTSPPAPDAPDGLASSGAILDEFLSTTLPRERWDHAAHLAVARALLGRHGLVEGERVMSRGIKRLNASHGTPETATRGYSRTVTCAMLALLYGAGGEDVSKDAILRHYSRERLADPRAKLDFVAPDIEPLPACAGLLAPVE